MHKPFDSPFMLAMQQAAKAVADDIQGCKLTYVQSDEVSLLLTDYDTLHTQAWFDYNLAKMVSVAASTMSVHFINRMNSPLGELKTFPVFDGRAFNIPREEVTNYFLWRARDWRRNSVLMYAQSVISDHKLLCIVGGLQLGVVREAFGERLKQQQSQESENGKVEEDAQAKETEDDPNHQEGKEASESPTDEASSQEPPQSEQEH
jgi:hypothetical protein